MSEETLTPEQQFERNQARIEELRTKVGLNQALQSQQEFIRDLEGQLEPPAATLGERLLRQMRASQKPAEPVRFGLDRSKMPTLAELRRNN